MSEEDKAKIEKAMSTLTRGNDIESAALILEKCVLENYIIASGRVNVLHIAVRQILNYIEETKNKGILDITREKVDGNNKISRIKEYAYQEISHLTEDIKDYIDDDKIGNDDIIQSLKEERSQWEDIEKIIEGKSNEELYMNWWRYGLYE